MSKRAASQPSQPNPSIGRGSSPYLPSGISNAPDIASTMPPLSSLSTAMSQPQPNAVPTPWKDQLNLGPANPNPTPPWMYDPGQQPTPVQMHDPGPEALGPLRVYDPGLQPVPTP